MHFLFLSQVHRGSRQYMRVQVCLRQFLRTPHNMETHTGMLVNQQVNHKVILLKFTALRL